MVINFTLKNNLKKQRKEGIKMDSKDIRDPRDPWYTNKRIERVFMGGPNGTEVISEEEHERRLNREAMKKGGGIRIKYRGKPIYS